MKTQFFALTMLLTFGLNKVNAQLGGNSQYNTETGKSSYSRTSKSRQAATNAKSYSNDIQLRVNGIINVEADEFVAVFNITQVAETMKKTDQLLNDRIYKFKQNLKAIGIDTGKINVTMISFVPKYDIKVRNKVFKKTYTEYQSGFELQKNILVKFKNQAKLNEIVSAGVPAEINNLVKVDYFVLNIQKVRDSLKLKCYDELTSKIKSYEKLGFKLDSLKKVISEDFKVVYPQTRISSYQAYSKVSLSEVKRKSSSQKLKEVHKTPSLYYEPVAYDEYDLVINPTIEGPVVQVSYSLVVKCFLKEEKANNYVITPQGEAKLLKLK